MLADQTRAHAVALGFATVMAVWTDAAIAQTQLKPGFNLFSAQQDQEIGRQSADAAEKQLPMLRDASIDAYIDKIGERLAAVAPGESFNYQFKVVNASDINAFALPGGYMYVNRGLIEAAKTEGQLAGVMAHEMAHVALRHGTSQASKAYVAQAGLGLLGGLVGKDDRSTEQRIASIGGFGLNALFLKYSRTAEEQADVAGAQMMAAAGYAPRDMADFFTVLAAEQQRNPSKVEQFFSSHPAPANRAARIDEEIRLLAVKPIRPVGGFAQAQTKLTRMRPAASMQQIAAGEAAPAPAPRSGNDRPVPEITVAGPSTQFSVFSQRNGLFEIGHPDNWRVYEADQGYGVVIAPEGGFVDTGGRERDLISGVIVNHYDPFEDEADDRAGNGLVEGNSSLVRATNDLLGTILRTNPDLKMLRDSERRNQLDGAPSLSVVLTGRSPVTRQQERVTLFTREVADDHIVYALFIAAERDYERLNETFTRMISSLQVDADATHGARQSRDRSSSNSSVALPTGTVLVVGFRDTLSSATSQPGDRFAAELVEPVLLNGRVAIPGGAVITGRVLSVEPGKRFGGRAQLNLEFTGLQVGAGRESPISASFAGQGASQTRRDATTIGAAAAGGAVLGHAIGKDDKDTVLGALIGGAIGTGIAARNKGEEVTLPEGVAVAIKLDAPFGG